MTKYHLASHFSRFNILALATFFLLIPGVTLGLEIGDEAPPFRLPG